MIKTEIYGYYAFGYNYSLIRRNGLLNYDKDEALRLLDELHEWIEILELQVTHKVSEELREITEAIRKGEEKTIAQPIATRVSDETDKIDPTLDAELQLRTAYVLTKKRYTLETLLDKPHDLLSANAYKSLSDTSKKDFQFSCIQIALNQPTAAAFHLMRALEEQVKTLYVAFKKTKRLEKPTWGAMTKQLRDKRAPKPSEKLLDHLDSMRIHFRNPTQHPNVFYTLDEAQDLLNQTTTAINMISSELPNR